MRSGCTRKFRLQTQNESVHVNTTRASATQIALPDHRKPVSIHHLVHPLVFPPFAPASASASPSDSDSDSVNSSGSISAGAGSKADTTTVAPHRCDARFSAARTGDVAYRPTVASS